MGAPLAPGSTAMRGRVSAAAIGSARARHLARRSRRDPRRRRLRRVHLPDPGEGGGRLADGAARHPRPRGRDRHGRARRRASGRSSSGSAPTRRSRSPTTPASTASPTAPSSSSSRARAPSRSSRRASGWSRSARRGSGSSASARRPGRSPRWLEVYYWQRVPITVDVERVLVWPDESCAGEPVVHGEPLPSPAAPQKPPGNGTAPASRRGQGSRRPSAPPALAARLGGRRRAADGRLRAGHAARPTPASRSRSRDRPAGRAPRRPDRSRVRRHMVGQNQRIHTGWLEAEGGSATYAPHTKAGYKLPPRKARHDLRQRPRARAWESARPASAASRPPADSAPGCSRIFSSLVPGRSSSTKRRRPRTAGSAS